ncbi:hypothetical protein GOBAR_AA04954 [Gossypium barbadense]|uniref:Uncharacterized protein n=1 Tax=Gossypium barbadense TaxID=3634 RepID=A0A2P5YJ90_GOSBA|nr:hypothetical protein GOBAR_AA04954 [Gossypium barbadense]
MLSSRGKKTAAPASKKRKGARCIDWATVEQVQLADAIRALLTTDPWELFFGIIKPTYIELTMELCSTFYLQTVMTNYDNPGTVQFRLGELIHQLSLPEFGENELHALTRHIHFSPSKCWHTLAPDAASYNPNRSKASVLLPSLRYLHAILAHENGEAYEDIPDDVPPQHEDPSAQSPPPSRPVHAAASYADISERFT